MKRRSSMIAAAIIASALGVFTGTASAGDRSPRACENAGVLSRISSGFSHQVRNVPHLPNVAISEFRKVHEHRYLPYREDRPIARRYCGATALLSDGRKRNVWYMIEEGQGLAGAFGDNVEFCVSGFDRWFVYNGHCRVLR